MAASAIAAAGLLALPGGASAAKWGGVVVDKDTARGTVATAMRSGEVRTVRLPAAAVKRARVAQRVAVGAAPLADGTYQAKRLGARGRGARATLRGAIVKTRGRRMYISAGDSVLAVRTAPSRRARAASVHGVGAGDLVVADVTLGAQGIQATDVRDVGDASMLELEGIVLGLSNGVLRLAVARRGEIQIAVPAGVLAIAPAAGDQVEVAVVVAEDGSFTLVALDAEDERDDDDHGLEVDEEDGEIEAEGVIAALSAQSISVRVGERVLTCGVPAGAVLSGFAVGDEVEAKCQLVDGALVLRKLESERVEFKVTDAGTFKLEDERTDDDADEEDDEEDDDARPKSESADDDDEEDDEEDDE